VNILFVMKHRGNAGSTHSIAAYMRVGRPHGHRIAIFGSPVFWLPGLDLTTDVAAFDRVIFLYESELYRSTRLQEGRLFATTQRAHRLLFDMDGMYNPLIRIDGYDRNHSSEQEHRDWFAHFDAVSDRVLKPTMMPYDDPKQISVPFYGFDPAMVVDPAWAPKRYDVMYVGHNWWRWREVSQSLLPAITAIRDKLGEIAFVGLWWDKRPIEGLAAGPWEAFDSDPETLHRAGIEIKPSVWYDQVIHTMSSARINIFTQRPLLRHFKHLTLKYFEIFYADTIPLMMLDGDHVASVYGPAARELTLPGRIEEKILDALARPDYYRGVVEEVRRYLSEHHSFDRRVEELIAAVH
jgi:hypothetical protein